MNQTSLPPVVRFQQNAVLEAEGITVAWSGVRALDGVSLHVGADEIVGLIGPNGAGKTTLINVLTGYVRPLAGTILLHGRDVTRTSPRHRARSGMVRTFQDVRMFVGLTVQESILVSAEVAGGSRRVARARVSELMDLFDLAGLSRQVCEVLSYGQQRRLAIARSLATRPAVLLLDEPAAGLNDAETDALGQEILRIPELAGCGILLIEHNMGLVNTVCSWLHVLDNGTEIFQGEPRDAFANPGVRDAYIGHGFSSRIALDLEAEGPS